MDAKYRIYARNPNLTRAGEVDNFGELSLDLKFNDISRWGINIQANDPLAATLLQPNAGIIVKRNGVTLISGPVTQQARAWDKTADVLTLAGASDMVYLDRRLALPVPAGPPYSGAAYDVRTGAAETVLRAYVNYNAGPAAAVARQVTGLTLAADLARGSSVTGRARFDNLLALLQALALQGGDLGFKVDQSGTSLIFTVYVPTDRTSTAIFSRDNGNLLAYDYTLEPADANYIIAGGQGEGTARVFSEAGDSAAVAAYGRIEDFKDARNISDTTELGQAVIEELAKRVQKSTLSITPLDTDLLAYGVGYNLGDKVTVIVDGQAITDVLREVKIKLTRNNGEEITPTVGTPGTQTILKTFQKIQQLTKRLGKLERGY